MNGGVCCWGIQTVVEHIRLGESEVAQHGVERAGRLEAVDVHVVEIIGEDMRPEDTAKDVTDGSPAFLCSLATALLLKRTRRGSWLDVEQMLVKRGTTTDEGHEIPMKGGGKLVVVPSETRNCLPEGIWLVHGILWSGWVRHSTITVLVTAE